MAAPGRQRTRKQGAYPRRGGRLVGSRVAHPSQDPVDRPLQVVCIGHRHVERIADKVNHADGADAREPRTADRTPVRFMGLGEARLDAIHDAGIRPRRKQRPGQQCMEAGQVARQLVRAQVRRIEPD